MDLFFFLDVPGCPSAMLSLYLVEVAALSV
jgi:hypothetical protein